MGVKFPYDKHKAEQAVLWFLHKHGGALPVLKLVKLIFYADRAHLVRYGRPIVGGRYVAMPHGPVASQLKAEIDKSKSARGLFVRKGHQLCAMAQVNEEYLSESDLEVLDEINRQFGALDTFKLRDMTHDLKAYKKNFDPSSDKRAFDLPYEDFFEDLDKKSRGILEIIREDHEARAALD